MRSLALVAALFAATPALADPPCTPQPACDGTVRGIQAVELPLVGVIVGGVTPRSEARCAGLRPRDVIVAVDGTPIHDVAMLETALTAPSPRVRVLRDGRDVEIVLGASRPPVTEASLQGLMTGWIRALLPLPRHDA